MTQRELTWHFVGGSGDGRDWAARSDILTATVRYTRKGEEPRDLFVVTKQWLERQVAQMTGEYALFPAVLVVADGDYESICRNVDLAVRSVNLQSWSVPSRDVQW